MKSLATLLLTICLLFGCKSVCRLFGCKDHEKKLTIVEGGGVSDVEGNSYKTIIIGDQEWMAENLKSTKYKDGTPIPLVNALGPWFDLSTPAYCWYNNDVSNKMTYGALYNWYAVNSSRLSPAGWHIPSDAEWKKLTDALGGDAVAGGKMKETGTTHWNSPNIDATNFARFNALPGGYNYASPESFGNIRQNGFWWTSTEFGTDRAYARVLFFHNGTIHQTIDYIKQQGLSVRCVKD